MDNHEEFGHLFEKYFDSKCNQDEIKNLLTFFEDRENEDFIRDFFKKHIQLHAEQYAGQNEMVLENIFSRIKREMNSETEIETVLDTRLPLYRRWWFRSAAAVLVVSLLISVLYVVSHENRSDKSKTVVAASTDIEEDIAPGKENAVLILGDNTAINLEGAANRTLAEVDGVTILKQNGSIIYRKEAGDMAGAGQLTFNTITTPNGGEYHLVLTDGTQIWLNAGSSIRFPIQFRGKERRVEISGEAYFEVAKMSSKPFKVDIAGREKSEIEVLGTHFNVSAYPDEKEVKTTLLEGSVKVRKADETKILKPGQQAKLAGDKIMVQQDVNIEEVMAWKDGLFIFNNSDLKSIMRQMARWYDVDVVFEGQVPDEGYTGKISKSLPLSRFIEVMEMNGVKLQMEGRKVIVK